MKEGSAANPSMAPCRTCRLPKPVAGLGSDGRCLDCRLEPIRASQPRLSSTQRRRPNGRPTAYTDD